MINIAITSYDIGEPPIYKNVGGFPHLLPIDYSNILDYLSSQNITKFNIIGGEPAIHADFEEIMYITNCFVNKHPSAKINLYTSGYNLYDKISLLGVNTNVILQWLENDVKISPEINKEILKTFQKLYELNYFSKMALFVEK